MAMVLCSKCECVDGVLCLACGKPNHFEQRRKADKFGWGGHRNDPCWRRLSRARQRFKQCEGHEAPCSECDNCRTRAPCRPPERGYVPPPIHVEMRTCPRPSPEQYRAELIEAALQVGWRCGPMGLGLRESAR